MATHLTVALNISKKAAITAGKTQFGPVYLSLSEEDLTKLSIEEREELANAALIENEHENEHVLNLEESASDISEATFESVRSVLIYRITKKAKQKEEEEQEKRMEIEKFLSMPITELIYIDCPYHTTTTNFCDQVTRKKFPETQDKINEVHKEIEKRNTELAKQKQIDEEQQELQRQRKELREQQKELEKEQAKEIKEQQKQQFVAFALAGYAGETAQRAASEGYDVRRYVIEAVIDQCHINDIFMVRSTDDDDYSWRTRSSPDAKAFKLHDQIVALVATVKKPTCLAIEVSKIMRIVSPDYVVDSFGNSCRSEKHTGIVVTLSSPVTERVHLLFISEYNEV